MKNTSIEQLKQNAVKGQNIAVIELLKRSGLVQDNTLNNSGYVEFDLGNAHYTIHPDGGNKGFFKQVQQNWHAVSPNERNQAVQGIVYRISNENTLSTSPTKSTVVTSSSEEDILDLIGDIEKSEVKINESRQKQEQSRQKQEQSRQKQEILEKQIKGHDENIQHSKQSIQQVTEWGNKEFLKLRDEFIENKIQGDELRKELKEDQKNWEKEIKKNSKKSAGCVIF